MAFCKVEPRKGRRKAHLVRFGTREWIGIFLGMPGILLAAMTLLSKCNVAPWQIAEDHARIEALEKTMTQHMAWGEAKEDEIFRVIRQIERDLAEIKGALGIKGERRKEGQ